MKNRINSKNIVISGLLLAIGLLLPMLFHAFGMAGQIFLPMHISIFIAGFILVPELALLVGLMTPILSSLFTGMPPLFPVAIIMMFELMTYAFVVSILSRTYKKGIYVSLISAMISGRLIMGLVAFILANGFGLNLNPLLYVKGAIVTGIPGLIVQLILIPILIKLLKSSNFSSLLAKS